MKWINDGRIGEIENSSLCRIIEESVKEEALNQDLLVEFIIKSTDNCFIFLKKFDFMFENNHKKYIYIN